MLSLDSISYSCAVATPGLSSAPLDFDRWSYGILAVGGDTRFFSVTSDTTADTIVWAVGGEDIDLFVKEGSPPTQTSYSSISRLGSSHGEVVRIPKGPVKTFFVAIQAYDKPTWYQIRASRLQPTNIVGLTANFSEKTYPDAVRSNAAETTRIAMRNVFSYTGGQYLIKKTQFWTDLPVLGDCVCNSNTCNVCFYQRTDRSFAPFGGTVHLFWDSDRDLTDGHVLTHEFGHSLFSQPDEYVDHRGPPNVGSDGHSDTGCMVSLMGSIDGTGSRDVHRYCTPNNHNTAPLYAGHVCTPGSPEHMMWRPNSYGCPVEPVQTHSMWWRLSNLFGLTIPATQPENTYTADFVFLDELFASYP